MPRRPHPSVHDGATRSHYGCAHAHRLTSQGDPKRVHRYSQAIFFSGFTGASTQPVIFIFIIIINLIIHVCIRGCSQRACNAVTTNRSTQPTFIPCSQDTPSSVATVVSTVTTPPNTE